MSKYLVVVEHPDVDFLCLNFRIRIRKSYDKRNCNLADASTRHIYGATRTTKGMLLMGNVLDFL